MTRGATHSQSSNARPLEPSSKTNSRTCSQTEGNSSPIGNKSARLAGWYSLHAISSTTKSCQTRFQLTAAMTRTSSRSPNAMTPLRSTATPIQWNSSIKFGRKRTTNKSRETSSLAIGRRHTTRWFLPFSRRTLSTSGPKTASSTASRKSSATTTSPIKRTPSIALSRSLSRSSKTSSRKCQPRRLSSNTAKDATPTKRSRTGSRDSTQTA